MRFTEETYMRVLPYKFPSLLVSVREQLKNGTIFECQPLNRYRNEEGIQIETQYQLDDAPDKPLVFYRISNDERRSLIRLIKQQLNKDHILFNISSNNDKKN